MIKSAKEFVDLRESKDLKEQNRAVSEEARIETWKEILVQFPEMTEWVILNKTIPIEILEELCNDENPNVREWVARKRKININIIERLSNDQDENVRYALMSNTKLSLDLKEKIKREDSDWLQKKYEEILILSQKKKLKD